MHATTKAIPPQDVYINDTNKAATEAGNFSIIVITASEMTGIGRWTTLNNNLWAMLPQNIIPAHINPVSKNMIAKADPWMMIDTVSDVGKVSGFGKIFIIKMNLKNSRDTVTMKNGVHVANALWKVPHLNSSPFGVTEI
jgi:hypothetical protein